MKKPRGLDRSAADFFERHNERLTENGLLTPDTEDAFIILCGLFSKITTFDPDTVENGWLRFFALIKSYQQFARGFGLSTDKPKQTKPKEPKLNEHGIPE